MVDKEKYLKQFKELHRLKTGEFLSDDQALEYFEQLVALVGTITSHAPPRKITTPNHAE